jgi:hypothetical protein
VSSTGKGTISRVLNRTVRLFSISSLAVIKINQTRDAKLHYFYALLEYCSRHVLVISTSPMNNRDIVNASLCSLLLTRYHSGDQMRENLMGGACGMYGDRRGAYRVFGGETRGKETTGKT